tara:strand:- start:1587 stop:2681 length:1095 start_codon:yes stop_codon:yes gene_type:complete
MNNIGDTVTGQEIVLNSFQSQIFSEVVKKLKKFGIAGYNVDFESYIIQKTLAEHIANTISGEEDSLREIPRMSQIVFQTLTNPDLYDSDIVSDGLLQWLEIGNPYSFFSKDSRIIDLSGLTNDARFPNKRVKPNGFRRNGTVDKRKIPSLVFSGRGSRLNASTVIDDVLEDGVGLKEGSVEMWINLDKKGMGARNQYHTLFNFHCPGTNYMLIVYVGRNGEVRTNKITYNSEDDKKRTVKSSQTQSGIVPVGEWIHLVINFTSNGPICYANTKGYKFTDPRFADMYDGEVKGFLDGFDSAELPDGTELELAPENLWIGARRVKTGKFSSELVGELSSFRVYSKVLEEEEIKQNFDESKGQYTGE